LKKLLVRAYARLPGAWENAKKELGRPPSGIFAYCDTRTTAGQILLQASCEHGTLGGEELASLAVASDELAIAAGVMPAVAAFVECEVFAAMVATMVDVDAIEKVREWLADPVDIGVLRIGVVARDGYKLIQQRFVDVPDERSPTPS